MDMNFEKTLIGLLMVVTLQLAQADDAPFDAYETVREAGIGTNAPDYYQYDNAGATKHYVAEPSAIHIVKPVGL